MTLADILENLLSMSSVALPPPLPPPPGTPLGDQPGNDATCSPPPSPPPPPEMLIRTLENEFNRKYQDPAMGLHFVGILLAVLAAQLVSSAEQPSTTTPSAGKMVSCLYCTQSIALT